MRLTCILTGLLLVLFSCKEDNPDPEMDAGYAYFPMQQGSWKEFQVDSIVWTPFGSDSSTWIIREVMDSVYSPADKVWEAIVLDYSRPVDSLNWIPGFSTRILTRTLAQAEEWTNNTRFIRFVFPVYTDRSWNGNAMNTLGEQEYSFQRVACADTIGHVYYTDLVTVRQQYSISLISRDVEEETFARNAGLVGVRKEHLSNLTGIKTGYEMRKVLVASGNF